MSLRKRQSEFTRKICELTLWAIDQGYEITDGDAYRDPRAPYGSNSSKHKRRLARDLNLFIKGEYQETTEAHNVLGLKWESMGGIWGGRFNDGNHYEAPDPQFEWSPHKAGILL